MFLNMTSLIIENKNTTLQVSESLILKMAKEDTTALKELYDQTYQAVYGFAYSILKNPYDAQDVAQDTFVKIYNSAMTYQCNGKPLAWIFTITRNFCLMKLRSGKRAPVVDIQDYNAKEDNFDSKSEYKIILEEALLKLPDDSRQIVILHSMTGLKHKEIAEILHMALPTVLSKYHRAIKKIKEIIKEDSIYEWDRKQFR